MVVGEVSRCPIVMEGCQCQLPRFEIKDSVQRFRVSSDRAA
jgi:hypothetical protein